jgi:predicted RNA binding protein YcfA (HicA-like mRNA interferase family)
MPKLHSSNRIITILQENGFSYVSQKGSHVKFRRVKGKNTRTVIVPASRTEIPHGTFHSILRQSGLTKADFD